MQPTRPQAVTNPENAQKSTGPTSDAGKAKVALNAITLGLTAKGRVLASESQEEYDALFDTLTAEMQPENLLERADVRELADEFWRLQRITERERVQANALEELETAPKLQGDAAEVQKAAIAEATRTLDRTIKYLRGSQLAINRLQTRWRMRRKDTADAARALERKIHLGETAAAAAAASTRARDEDGRRLPAPDAGEKIDWQEVAQQLYYAVSAGPQEGHPLRETYYGAYAIWQKQQWMVEQDIGDDEAGSQLAAVSIAFSMCQAGVRPIPGTVWGAPDDLAQWRERAKKENPFPQWKELVLRDYGRRGVRLEGPEEGKSQENDK